MSSLHPKRSAYTSTKFQNNIVQQKYNIYLEISYLHPDKSAYTSSL